MNTKTQISDFLKGIGFNDVDQAVDRRLQNFGIKPGNFKKVPNGTWGYEIVVDAESVILTDDLEDSDSNQGNQLTVNHVGRYLLVNDWCVWITCDDEKVRTKAAIQRALQWLQKAYSNPLPEEIDRFIELVNKRLHRRNPLTKS